MNQLSTQNRRIHADRTAFAVNRDLSSAIGQLCEMGRLLDPEFHTVALEVEKLQRRVAAIAERVQ